MNKIEIDERDIIDFIFDTLYSSKISLENLENAKFHHNTNYKNAPLVCRYGIMPLLELNKIGIRNDSKELLKRMDDTESHINGNDGISLAVLGLKDLYSYENEYNPLDPRVVDFIISNNIKAHRNTLHYGNEYIHYGSIELENILSLDFRLLEYISLKENNQVTRNKLIEMYNCLLEAVINIKQLESGLLLREMSLNNSFGIDIDKFSKSNSLILKK